MLNGRVVDMKEVFIQSISKSDSVLFVEAITSEQQEPFQLIVATPYLEHDGINLIKDEQSLWVDGEYTYKNGVIEKAMALAIVE